MSVLEKNQRLLRRRAKKIEDRLTSIESKVEPSHGEDMDFRQWDNDTYEEKDKACSEKEKANAEHEAGKEKDNIENTEEEGEKEADDNAQQEGEKEKENSEADEEEDSESESEELKQMKERSRRQAAKLWKEIANEEKIGGKHDEEESEEKEAETSEEENENNDEKDEEKVVESEAEGEDDQVEVGGKEDQEEEVEGKEDEEEEVEGKESETREKEKEKNETEEVESEARETEIEKGTPTPPRGNQTEGTPKDDDNEPRVETNRTGETPTPPHGSQSERTPKDDDNEPRVETNRTGETPTPPRGSQLAGTPTPPRGRTKAMAARRPIIRRMEDEPGKGEKVVEEEKQKKEAVETEEKNKGFEPPAGLIASEVFDQMQLYMNCLDPEERRIRKFRMKKVLDELSKDSIAQYAALRMEDAPVISKIFNKDKGLVFDYKRVNETVPPEVGESSFQSEGLHRRESMQNIMVFVNEQGQRSICNFPIPTLKNGGRRSSSKKASTWSRRSTRVSQHNNSAVPKEGEESQLKRKAEEDVEVTSKLSKSAKGTNQSRRKAGTLSDTVSIMRDKGKITVIVITAPNLSKWYITIFILRNFQVSDQIYLRKYNLSDWLCVIALNNDKDRFRPAGIDIVTGWGRHFRVTATSIVRQTVEELLYILGSAFFMEIENSDCLVVCGESLIALV
ncbi:unnamed protein product [Brassica napus]|uniref:(rape) hypothetical protein n=1 Tax=Brassica napus TaxID=3708 RepID=A0A817BBS9_BRANA|nr:unnamed protein product [Brassica napus]